MFISVVIPAYNEEKHIASCLESLGNQTYSSDLFEVIVVDNESTDFTSKIAKQYDVRLFENQKGNVGKIRNIGAQHANGDILAFIDADCVTDPNWLSRAVQLIKNNPNTIFGGGCFLPKNPTLVEKAWLLGDSGSRLPKDLIGASIVIKKDIFNRLGGFDEAVTSGEDTALSKNAQKMGIPIEISEALSVSHLGNAKTLKEFLKRQIWHGENYLTDIKSSLVDPTFILIATNIFIIFVSILVKLSTVYFNIFLLIAAPLLIPFIFSAKRILRSNHLPTFTQLFLIYILDFLYIQSRSYSLLRSLVKILI